MLLILCMSNEYQAFDLQLKRLGLVTLLCVGCCLSAFAQTSPEALPALPGLPALPLVPSAPVAASPSADPAKVTATPATSSALPPLPETKAAAEKAPAVTGSKTPPRNTLADLPAPQPEVAAAPAAIPALPSVPDLPVPSQPEAAPPIPAETLPETAAMAVPPMPGAEETATSIPEIKVVREKAEKKSWQTTLATTVVIPKTNFNYRREQLPEVIYRTRYSRENDHLPRRITREDYANLLFHSVARNDVNATRALLNAGTSLNVTTPYGETPLMLARRSGAVEVAQLLEARGAR